MKPDDFKERDVNSRSLSHRQLFQTKFPKYDILWRHGAIGHEKKMTYTVLPALS